MTDYDKIKAAEILMERFVIHESSLGWSSMPWMMAANVEEIDAVVIHKGTASA